jgi:hypothetical protein
VKYIKEGGDECMSEVIKKALTDKGARNVVALQAAATKNVASPWGS